MKKFHITVWLAKRWADNMGYTDQKWYDQVWNYVDSALSDKQMHPEPEEPVIAG